MSNEDIVVEDKATNDDDVEQLFYMCPAMVEDVMNEQCGSDNRVCDKW